MALLKALNHRPFALLWSGQTLSRFGDSLYHLALAWWVVEKTGSAAAMGNVAICAFIPTLIFALIGGVSVDRWPRVPIMLLSDVLRGLLVIGVSVLAAKQVLDVWHVYLASILFGAVNAFFLPAYTALIPDITPAELLPSANALTSLSAEVSGVVGPAVAALVIGVWGSPVAFGLDGVSFVVSALCLLPLLRQTQPHQPSTQNASLLRDVREGFATVTRSTWLWFTIVLLALLNLTGRSPMNVSLPFLVKNELQAQVVSLGALYSIFSLGSIAGAVAIGRVRQLRHRGVIVYVGLVIVGVATAAMSLPITLIGVAIALFVLGAALAVSNLTWSNILQDKVDRAVLGRVASINLLGSTSLLPIGFAVAGGMTDAFGAAAVFALGGILMMALAIIGLAIPSIRNLD